MSVVLLSRLSYCHAQNAPFLPRQLESGSNPTYAHKSDCRATWSKCGDTTQVLSAEEKVAVPEKNQPFWVGKHSSWHSACRLACRAEARTHFNWHKKMEDDNMRKRNTTIAIRCTEEENRRVHELAKRHGLKLNDFIMRCALGKKIVVANGIDEIVRQQKAIGRNLNQIATLANMDRLTAVNFQPLLDEHRKVTELIGQLLREVK